RAFTLDGARGTVRSLLLAVFHRYGILVSSAPDPRSASNDSMRADPEKILPPSRELLLLEARSILEFGAFFALLPWLRTAPRGDGHPVTNTGFDPLKNPFPDIAKLMEQFKV